jgi:hypothetical protein
VGCHGVAVLTMSKPWRQYLLPSEWLSVNEKTKPLNYSCPMTEPSPTSKLALHESPAFNQRSHPVSFFLSQTFKLHTTSQPQPRKTSQIQSISHIFPEGRRRGALAMVNRVSHPSGRIPERAALPPDETNCHLP